MSSSTESQASGDPLALCPHAKCRELEAISGDLGRLPEPFSYLKGHQCSYCSYTFFRCMKDSCPMERGQRAPWSRDMAWRHCKHVHHTTKERAQFDAVIRSIPHVVFHFDDGSINCPLHTIGMGENPHAIINYTPIWKVLKKHQEGGDQDEVSLSHYQSLADIPCGKSDFLSHKLFFDYHHSNKGLQYLASLGVCGKEHCVKAISMSDAIYHVRMAKMCYSMTPNQLIEYVEVKQLERQKMNQECQLVPRSEDPSEKGMMRTAIYSTLKEINQHCLKCPSSIIKNMPMPAIQVINDHAYASPRAILSYLFAFGTKFDFTCKVELPVQPPEVVAGMWDSARGRTIAKQAFEVDGGEDAVVVYFTEWSDDYEPNTQAKQSRGSVWALTMNVSPPVGYNGFHNAGVVAIGHKQWNHKPVVEKFWSEVNQLRSKATTFYHGGLKAFVPVVACHAASLKDTPERRSVNGIIAAAGSYGLATEEVVQISHPSIQRKLPSCQACLKRRVELSGQPNSECRKCLDWDLSREGCSTPAPKQIQESKNRDDKFLTPDTPFFSQGPAKKMIMVRPLKRTYSLLRDCSQVAFKKLCKRDWGVGDAKSFLSVVGVSGEQAVEIVEAAKTQRQANANPADDVLAGMCPMHPAWGSKSPLSTNIPVPMHLFFHGLAHSSINLVLGWLKSISKGASFGGIFRSRMLSVSNLRLCWAKALPVSSDLKMGGHVAENYLALTRLMKWLFAPMAHVLGLPESGNLTMEEMFRRGKLDDCFCMMELTQCVIARAMQKEWRPACDADDIDRHCKLLLSAITKFEQGINVSSSDDPSYTWRKKANHAALMGSVQHYVQNYPPFRSLWEGGCAGEGLLRSLKPVTHQVSLLGRSWPVNCMMRYYRMDALHRMDFEADQEATDSGLDSALEEEEAIALETHSATQVTYAKTARNQTFVYHSGQAWYDLSHSVVPISGVMESDSGSICIIKKKGRLLKDSVVGATVSFDDEKGELVVGSWYAPIVFQEVPADQQQTHVMKDDDRMVLLLPLNLPDQWYGDNDCKYCCIDNEWNERDKHGQMGMPKYSKACY